MEWIAGIFGYIFILVVVLYALYELMKKAVKDGLKEYEREKRIKAKKEAAKAAETEKERDNGTEIK